MKKIQLFPLILISGLVLSCTKEATTATTEQHENTSDNIICYYQSSKTELGDEVSGAYPILWSSLDEIMVFSQDGTASSLYTLSSQDEKGVGTFVSSEPVKGSGRSAVYPADAFLGYSQDGSLRVDLSGLNSQSYSSGLSDKPEVGCYPLWAVEDSQENGKFAFNGICGCFVLQLNDYQGFDVKISSVEIKSASKSLSGIFRVNPSTGSITAEDSQTKSGIKLTSDNAIPISGQTPVLGGATECFLIAIPAGTYPAGDLSFVITDNQGRVFSKTISSEVELTPGKVKKMAKLQLTLFYGKANCAIVEPGSTISVNAEPYYSFNPLYGYENNRVMTSAGTKYYDDNAEAVPIWELAEGAGAFSEGSVLSSCQYSDGIIKVSAGSKRGNALVALKDESGKILWSFHIWVTDTPADHAYTNIKGGVFMDRNLGATNLTRCKADKTSLDVMGLYYQHGRKDPFACSLSQWDSVLSESETVSENNGTIAYTIQHPQVRIINTVAKYHWNNYGDNLSFWGSKDNLGTTNAAIIKNCENEEDSPKTVYDPCPEGYKVPLAKYLNFNLKDATKAKLSSTGTDMLYDGTNKAYWPMNGYMCHNGDEITTADSRRGTVICNWTTGANTGYSVRLFATSSAYTLTTNAGQGRAVAAGVRCMKINKTEGDQVNVDSQMEEPEDETL